MLWAFLQGSALGAAMIIAIGPQNAFVITQGIKRHYHLMIATFCALSDILLIVVGVFGGATILSSSFILMQIITWAGSLFLLYYGWGAFRQVICYQKASFTPIKAAASRKKTLLTLVAVTWLNPHVYIDTVVIVGGAAAQFDNAVRPFFALGAVCTSILWFYLIALLAAWFGPVLEKPKAQRIINLIITLIMWVVAYQLAVKGCQQLILHS